MIFETRDGCLNFFVVEFIGTFQLERIFLERIYESWIVGTFGKDKEKEFRSCPDENIVWAYNLG